MVTDIILSITSYNHFSSSEDMKDKIGITLTFDNILKQDHIKLLPITHLQILFQNKLQFLYPTEQDLYNVRSYLKNKDIETIVHISV